VAFEERTRLAVNKSQVFVGMRAEDARRSWGNPKKINRSSYNNEIVEQWIYPRGRHIYVRSGLVVETQERTTGRP
jgi:hypothetical protein